MDAAVQLSRWAACDPLNVCGQEPYVRFLLPFFFWSRAPFFCGAFWVDKSFSSVIPPFELKYNGRTTVFGDVKQQAIDLHLGIIYQKAPACQRF